MKKTMMLLNLMMALAVIGFSPKSQQASATTNVQYTVVDTNQENVAFGNVRSGESAGGTYTIVGFNVQDGEDPVVLIERLGLNVKYNTYAFWDLAKLFPQKHVENVVVSVADTNTWADTFRYKVGDQNHIYFASFSFPSIGTVASLIEKDTNATANLTQYGYEGCIQIDGEWVHVADSDFADYRFYVVMPFENTYEELIISISGLTESGLQVSDGTDDGVPFENENGKYIELNQNTARSVVFMGPSLVKEIELTDFNDTGSIMIYFGDFNYQTETWRSLVSSTELTIDGNFPINALVNASDVALIKFIGGATGRVLVYYESNSVAVLSNVLGDDGIEQPVIVEPEEKNSFTFLLDLYNTGTAATKTIMIAFTVMVVSGMAIMFISFIVWLNRKFFKKHATSKRAYSN